MAKKSMTKDELIARLDADGGIDIEFFKWRYFSNLDVYKGILDTFEDYLADLIMELGHCDQDTAIEVVKHYYKGGE